MRKGMQCIVCIVCLCVCASCAGKPALYKEAEATICYGMVRDHQMILEVADDPGERAMGLKFRKSLGQNSGMIFVYPDETVLSFWMKDTFLDLDIAFLDEEGTIINIQRMFAHDLRPVSSQSPAMYAIEMHVGWFAERGIRSGDMIDIATMRFPHSK